MGTSTEVVLDEKKPAAARHGLTKRAAKYLGIALLVAGWIWAAFLRERGLGNILPAVVAIAVFVGVFGILWFFDQRSRRKLSAGETSAEIIVSTASAFFLLAVFLPDYLLAKPPALVRSLILGGLALLLCAIFSALHKQKLRRTIFGISPMAFLVCFCVLYFLLTSWLSIRKLHVFGYVGQDLAYFTQCLYTTLHGHLFYSNLYHDLLYSKPVSSDLAGHNQPVLFLFLPFYALHQTAATLLIIRNVFVVLCAWPVYLISRQIVKPWTAAVTTVAFLLLPAVLYQNLYDFAPLSLAGFPLLFAFYFYLEGKLVPFLVFVVATQLVREDLVFAVFGLGLLALWQRRPARWVFAPGVLAIVWAVLSWKVLFPYFLHGSTSAVASCFSYLGTTPGQMASALLHHPRALFSHENLVYLKHIMEPFGGVLFLFNPAWLLAIPYMGINVLAEGGGCNTAMIYRHYSLIPVVLLFVAFLLSLRRLQHNSQRPEARSAALVFFVLFAGLASNVFVTGRTQFQEWQSPPWHSEAIRVAQMIPPEASVAAPRYLLPSLANRQGLYQSLRLVEYHHPTPQFVVIDKDWERMAATQQWRDNYFLLWKTLRESPQYTAIYDSPNYVIFRLCQGCAGELPHMEPGQVMHD